ncbi:MAG: M48 family metalloprotease [Thermoleophilia bacterium]
MYEQINRNRRASWLLLGIAVALLAALGYVFGLAYFGRQEGALGFLGVFGVIAIAWSVIAYYTGGRMVLAVSGAHQVSHDDEPQLFNVVEEMTIAAGLPQVPGVYLIEDDSPNAFATGRDPEHAAVAVTRGLLRLLNREELQGVLAHEIAHVRNYDIRFATLVGVIVGMIALVADFFLRSSFWGGLGRRRSNDPGGIIMFGLAVLMAILAPLAAYLVQLAVSRRREYLADASAAELTRNPVGLARALQKIATAPQVLRRANRATAHLYIANPMRKVRQKSGIFDTHPPIEKRIDVLLSIAGVGRDALLPQDTAPSDEAGTGPWMPGAPTAPAPPPPMAP